MWCILELFTFVRSGGREDQIDLKPLNDTTAVDAIAALDVDQADCYLREDKQRILAIVESSYGHSSQFNNACRRILFSKMGTAWPQGKAKAGDRYRTAQVAPEGAGK